MININDIWHSASRTIWQNGLDLYWNQVSSKNRRLEEDLDRLDIARVKAMRAESWYNFLHDEYFRWKYTQPNRYASTTKLLDAHVEKDGTVKLDAIRCRLLDMDFDDIESALAIAQEVPGLGVAGASGLLALLYPLSFGTVDQFVVGGLLGVSGLPEHCTLARMRPQALKPRDGAVLTRIMRKKAAENTKVLGQLWTPRMIDKVLWGYRGSD